MAEDRADAELYAALRQLNLAFPEVEEITSHGAPNFRVRGGKTFATYALNHHGDGRIALWLCAPAGMQDALVRTEPKHYFVPAYVGPSGWLGVRLDTGRAWRRVAEAVRTAYECVAPPRLRERLHETPQVPAPTRRITVADIDPWRTPRGKRLLEAMRTLCLEWPGTAEDTAFGQPIWRVGKKTFARLHRYTGWHASFWVGVHAQSLMTNDPRFSIPAYTGHQGWINLDVATDFRIAELRALALESYRHYAGKAQLAALANPTVPATASSRRPARSRR